VLNITLSVAKKNEPPTGITRVERELVRQFYKRLGDNLVPVFYDYDGKKWCRVKNSFLKEITSQNDSLSKGTYDPVSFKKNLTTFDPKKGDRFVSAGSDWSFEIPSSVASLYNKEKVLISACYDLIPLLYPEFAHGPEFFEQFKKHYTDIAKYGRAVFSISECSKRDLLDFWKKNDLSDMAPPVEVIPLAKLHRHDTLPELDMGDNPFLDRLIKNKNYVVYVSTLEPRKNHQLLLDLWHQLFKDRGEKCPCLVIVGSRGWGSDDLVEQLQRMTATKSNKIYLAEGVSDQLLAHLYANSLFALFPSFYEGWGLAATEVMAFGKVCVVSNTSSLGEATYDLTPSYHPLDFPGWLKEIERLIDDPNYRTNIEKKIRSHLPERTWSQFADDFFRKVL